MNDLTEADGRNRLEYDKSDSDSESEEEPEESEIEPDSSGGQLRRVTDEEYSRHMGRARVRP